MFPELITLAILFIAFFALSYTRASSLRKLSPLHSKPAYHGANVAINSLWPPLLFLFVAYILLPQYLKNHALSVLPAEFTTQPTYNAKIVASSIKSAASSLKMQNLNPEMLAATQAYLAKQEQIKWTLRLLALVASLFLFWKSYQLISPKLRAKNMVEKRIKIALFTCAIVAVLTTVGIVLSLSYETMRFFAQYPVWDFLTGLKWSPQTAIRTDQVASSGAFGIVPLLTGTLLITLVAIFVAGPIGLFAAIYLAEYASENLRARVKPLLEILAGIPTVVFGFFAALTIAPFIRNTGEAFGLNVASESALAAGIVMGFMIIPFISSLSDDVISAVPQALRDGSYALGATRSETIKRVILPAALPGIVSAFMLAISRAIGETMIVVMAAGLIANLTLNPLDAVTTFTVQIKTMLVGDQEFDSVKTLSAFALGFVLFFTTLVLNIIALRIVRKYREQYD